MRVIKYKKVEGKNQKIINFKNISKESVPN